jgi:uncharacterized membrane protein YkvA (DUF1232 family)
MATRSFKVTFTLDETDAKYFRDLYRTAKENAAEVDPAKILAEVKRLIARVRKAERVPSFVSEAVLTLEDLIQMLEDEAYELPKTEATRALTALAYFANPHDVVPDHIPGLGFLDDAIMMKFVEEEFKHELWAYRKFRAFREGAEHRPWTKVAQERLPRRLVEYRRELREKMRERKERENVVRALGRSIFGR